MERFVTLIVAGGLALVCGLWLATALPVPALARGVGAALALGGTAALAVGIGWELDY